MKRLPFRVEMARAWHEGRKTVTRRIVKPQPYIDDLGHIVQGKWNYGMNTNGTPNLCNFAECRATYPVGSTVIIAEPLVKGKLPGFLSAMVCYAADNRHAGREHTVWHWKVSRLSGRYMPNWAARSWGRIVSVRVERLQEITEEDAIREGVESQEVGNFREVLYRGHAQGRWYETARSAFQSLFQHINGPESWDANPWVFRYELERLTQNPAVAA